MGWKKITLKDFSRFLDVFVKTQLCVVDLVSCITKSANETQFRRKRCKTKVISQYAHKSFLAVNACNRKMGVVVD